MIGVHWTAVDDDGNKFGNLFDVSNSWNIKPFPTRFTLDRYFVYGWSVEMAASYAAYTPEKLVNDSTGREGINLSIDFNAKYSFYNLYAPSARWIDPFILAGVGFTYRTGTADPYVPTVNLGGGINSGWPIGSEFNCLQQLNLRFTLKSGIQKVTTYSTMLDWCLELRTMRNIKIKIARSNTVGQKSSLKNSNAGEDTSYF